MEFKQCSRCGCFYLSDGYVCPNCTPKDNLEFAKFQSYYNENGIENSIETISYHTGITEKNINRFMKYDDFKNIKI